MLNMFALLNHFVFLGLWVKIMPLYGNSNVCECNDTVTPTFSYCSSISDIAGTVCYGMENKKLCAHVSCKDASTYEAECTDNNGQGTWSGFSECGQVVTTPIAGTTIATSTEITPTPSTSYTTILNASMSPSSSAVTSVDSTSIQVTSTEHVTRRSEQTSDDNVAVYVSVPIVIVVIVIIAVIILIIFLRRRARRKGENIMKEPLHGSVSNNTYPHHEWNSDIIPMTNLEPEAQNNTYTEIADVENKPITTTDDHYNTINILTVNEYDHLKPLAKSVVDNTYSHANKSQTVDNTYNHTEKATTNPITTQKSKDADDDSYSHLGKDFVLQEKEQPVVEGDNAYNTLNAPLQHNPLMKNTEKDKDPEYNHLTSVQQTALNNNATDANGTDSFIAQAPLHEADTVQGSAVSHQYDQVVEADNKTKEDEENNGQKRAFKIADADNDREYHSYLVLEAEHDENAENTSTETDHQYFTLEKHEKE